MKNNDFVILVTGIPASGKSMLAEKLSADLGFPWFSKDRIKEKLYDTIGFASRAEKVRLGIASMAVLCYLAEQMMQCGKSFILENNFEADSRPEGASPSPTITLEQYIAAIRARKKDSFDAGGRVITVDTTDFSRVDWDKLYQEIECFVWMEA